MRQQFEVQLSLARAGEVYPCSCIEGCFKAPEYFEIQLVVARGLWTDQCLTGGGR